VPEKRTITRALIVATIKAAALLIFLGGTTWAVVYYHDYLWSIIHQRDRFKDWVLSWGAWGPVVFIGFQVVQIVIFVIPGELTQAAAGYLFGTWLGTFYSLIGSGIGSALAFLLSDWLGRPLVKLLVRPDQFDRLERALNTRKGLVTVFVLFLIPGTPKDTLCYVAGLTPIRFWRLVILSTLARTPGILLSSVLGESVYERNYHEFIAFCCIGLVGLIVGIVFRKRIEAWISRRKEAGR
jgi:uncharacterized membrane protein YdjX (TVP38/TMEM64 family)